MAGSKTVGAESIVLNHLLSLTSYAPTNTTNGMIALSTAAFNASASGDTIPSEVSGGGYARVTYTVSNMFVAATGSTPASSANQQTVTFPTASASWGTILSFYILQGSGTGNVLYGADISPGKTIYSGDIASFSVGGIVVTEG